MMIPVTVMSNICKQCGVRLRRIKKKSWRKGYHECPRGHMNWYRTIQKMVRKRWINDNDNNW